MTTNLIFSGVGGQGVLLMSDVVSLVALYDGKDVKKSEIHGMAQRGGSVVSHLRFGEKVYSPLIPYEKADFLISLEKLEALRSLDFLKPGGRIILNPQIIPPLPTLIGKESYPEEIERKLRERGILEIIPGTEIARKLGNPKVVNTILLGRLSLYLPFDTSLWRKAINQRFPFHLREINLRAFEEGRKHENCGDSISRNQL